MPYLLIQTNRPVAENDRAELLAAASRTVAEALGKPERYVMVALQDAVPMCFAGDDAPLAYLELKSIGLPEARTAELSAVLCDFIAERLDLAPERIYIEFSDAPRAFWGWNRGTF